MTPTLPTDLISAKDVLEKLNDIVGCCNYCEPKNKIVCGRCESLIGIVEAIQSGRFAPAVHSADGLKQFIDAIEKVAFSMPPPNDYTPQIVSLCISARASMNTRQGAGWMPSHGLDGLLLNERVAQITAHRACGNQEQDIMSGKLSGYCVVCQVPWPCQYAGTPPVQPLPTAPGQSPAPDEVGK